MKDVVIEVIGGVAFVLRFESQKRAVEQNEAC
jgi:hypothetical protein